MPNVSRSGILPANFSVTINREILPTQHRLLIAAFAATKLAEVQAINRAVTGQSAKYKMKVDGREGGSIFNVKFDGGRIVYDFEIASVKDIAEEALKALRSASPVVSGAYRDGHTIFVEGESVADLNQIKTTDQIIIANPVPYARRLEIGRTKSGRPFLVSVPNRIYERITQSLVSKYQGRAKIQFRYLELEGAYQVTGKMQQQTPRYATGKFRVQTQTHWVGTGAGGEPGHWVTYEAGGAKTHIRRQKTNVAVQAPAIVIQPLAT